MNKYDVNELAVFDKGLIKVYETDTGELIIDGREMWHGVESKQQFTDWIEARLEECDAVENKEFFIYLRKTSEKGGRPSKEYVVQLDTAKEMVMLERNEIGKQYRKYFIEVEKKYKKGEQEKHVQSDGVKAKLAEAKLNNSKARLASLYLKIGDNALTPTYQQIMYSKATEVLAGELLLPLPKMEQQNFTARDIGKRLNISANKVGHLTNENDLKNDAYGQWVHDKAKNCDKQIKTFRYYENVIPVLQELLDKEAKKETERV